MIRIQPPRLSTHLAIAMAATMASTVTVVGSIAWDWPSVIAHMLIGMSCVAWIALIIAVAIRHLCTQVRRISAREARKAADTAVERITLMESKLLFGSAAIEAERYLRED